MHFNIEGGIENYNGRDLSKPGVRKSAVVSKSKQSDFSLWQTDCYEPLLCITFDKSPCVCVFLWFDRPVLVSYGGH